MQLGTGFDMNISFVMELFTVMEQPNLKMTLVFAISQKLPLKDFLAQKLIDQGTSDHCSQLQSLVEQGKETSDLVYKYTSMQTGCFQLIILCHLMVTLEQSPAFTHANRSINMQ